MLLEALERKVPQGIKYEDLRIYWLEYCRLSNNKNYDFGAYINFLKVSLLITIENNVVKLSKGGKGFLNYIRNNYPTIYALRLY